MGMRIIKLTKNRIALIDEEDFERVNQYKWYAGDGGTGKYYAKRRPYHKATGKYGTVAMHRFIMDAPIDMEVDHIDGNSLNNQKYNLRICTHAENSRNLRVRKSSKTGYRGVSFDTQTNSWRATITYQGIFYNLGRYKSFEDAIKARKLKEKELFGEFS